MEGSANDLTISASGGSHFELSEFPVHDANVDLDSGSYGTINLDDRLDADLSGGARAAFTIGVPADMVWMTVRARMVCTKCAFDISFSRCARDHECVSALRAPRYNLR